MDLEAVQLLNLSPIPELSELELSTMLEQLSGLSDLNGDLTDRNVEDILKEAENLIDSSMSSKINELPISDSILEQCPSVNSQNVNEVQESLNDMKNSSSPIETLTPKSSPIKTHEIKHYNSPVDQSNKIFSPGGSCNLIKSTIDSLKEFSTLVEKQLSSRSLTSPTHNQNYSKEEKHLKKSTDRITNLNQSLKNAKQKPNTIIRKNPEVVKINKPSRLLNCFERLYQERPNRLSKKQKVSDKKPKTLIRKKFVKDIKNQMNIPQKTTWDRNRSEELKNKENERISEISLPKHYLEVDNWLKSNNSKCLVPSTYMFHSPPNRTEDDSENELVLHKLKSPINDLKMNNASKISSQIDEKLILKLLQGMEEIKDHVKNASVAKNEIPQKIVKESPAVIDSLRSEVETISEKVVVESMKNTGIKRLEEQFAILKEKYDQHIKKLEAENLQLREAFYEKFNPKATTSVGFIFQLILLIDKELEEILRKSVQGLRLKSKFENLRQAELFADRHLERELASNAETEPPIEANKCSTTGVQSSYHSQRKIFRSFSLENCRAPKNSPCSSLEDIRSSARKEAFSQTEKEVRSTSIQCVEELKPLFEEVTIEKDEEEEEEEDNDEDMKKTENKENITGKKKPGRERPFSEKNTHQLWKQKKMISSHESQLLATLRGLQAELTLKEKENRKLKTEIDLLKSQVKKSGKKMGGCKRRHIGTQTIGLGSIVQKPYNPEDFEVPGEYEKENEELKSKIKALEEAFEALKEKRLKDLQSLHQVHEEEMAKLLSKLETQSALTKHLHSLLMNR